MQQQSTSEQYPQRYFTSNSYAARAADASADRVFSIPRPYYGVNAYTAEPYGDRYVCERVRTALACSQPGGGQDTSDSREHLLQSSVSALAERRVSAHGTKENYPSAFGIEYSGRNV